MNRRQRRTAAAVAGVVLAFGAFWIRGTAGPRVQVREIVVVGDDFAFAPSRIEVQKDDLVQIRFTAKDLAHSFTIDLPYRISKRAAGGQTVVFEFRADEAGRFPFYCNLKQDDRCKKMRGELIVR
ncbi:MAG TPA: cupredoxin domain-containing protein [Vicinamibacterales bacterium]|jgi:heme/copper-type cytochrome/quinol oxidase subunit 2